MKHCKLLVSNKQVYDSHEDNNKDSYEGSLTKKNNNIYIIYKEEDKCEGTVVTNQIKVSKDGSVDVRRMGDHKSLLKFNMDRPYTTFYNTGQGSIQLTFKPIDIVCLDTDRGYRLELKYDIYMGGDKLSYNEYLLEAEF